MKDKVKEILKIVLFEAILFSALMPYVDPVANLKHESARWIFGYLFFFGAVMAAVTVKTPKVFFPVWLVCAAADFALDRKSPLLLALIPVAVWVLLNVIEPMNAGELKEKAQMQKAIGINAAFFVIVAAITVAIIVALKVNVQFTLNAKYYRAPWIVLTLYYIYSVAVKSNIPPIVKARDSLKKIRA